MSYLCLYPGKQEDITTNPDTYAPAPESSTLDPYRPWQKTLPPHNAVTSAGLGLQHSCAFSAFLQPQTPGGNVAVLNSSATL